MIGKVFICFSHFSFDSLSCLSCSLSLSPTWFELSLYWGCWQYRLCAYTNKYYWPIDEKLTQLQADFSIKSQISHKLPKKIIFSSSLDCQLNKKFLWNPPKFGFKSTINPTISCPCNYYRTDNVSLTPTINTLIQKIILCSWLNSLLKLLWITLNFLLLTAIKLQSNQSKLNFKLTSTGWRRKAKIFFCFSIVVWQEKN